MLQIPKAARALLALVISGGAAVSFASAPATTVHYADLDLAQSRDVAILYQRIRGAAARLCGPRELGGPDVDSRLYFDCITNAVDRAVTMVDRPTLSAYHTAHIRR